MKDKKRSVDTAPKMQEATVATSVKEAPKRPIAFSIKKETLIKFAVGFVIALALIPALDWVIQTSITSQYVAFFKDTDVSRSAYLNELQKQDAAQGNPVLNEMLAKSAIAQGAKDKKLKVTDADVNAAIEADKKKAGITTDEAFKAELKNSGITEAEYRAYVKITVTLDKLINGTTVEPTDKEIQAYFDENKTQFTDKKLADVKTQIIDAIKQSNLTTKRQEWLTKAMEGYNSANNTLTSETNKSYKFLKSIELVKRLFSKDVTK